MGAEDTVSYTYTNGLRRAMSIARPNASAWQVSYQYDVVGRLEWITSPAGAFRYAYQTTDAKNGKGTLVKSSGSLGARR